MKTSEKELKRIIKKMLQENPVIPKPAIYRNIGIAAIGIGALITISKDTLVEMLRTYMIQKQIQSVKEDVEKVLEDAMHGRLPDAKIQRSKDGRTIIIKNKEGKVLLEMPLEKLSTPAKKHLAKILGPDVLGGVPGEVAEKVIDIIVDKGGEQEKIDHVINTTVEVGTDVAEEGIRLLGDILGDSNKPQFYFPNTTSESIKESALRSIIAKIIKEYT